MFLFLDLNVTHICHTHYLIIVVHQAYFHNCNEIWFVDSILVHALSLPHTQTCVTTSLVPKAIRSLKGTWMWNTVPLTLPSLNTLSLTLSPSLTHTHMQTLVDSHVSLWCEPLTHAFREQGKDVIAVKGVTSHSSVSAL